MGAAAWVVIRRRWCGDSDFDGSPGPYVGLCLDLRLHQLVALRRLELYPLVLPCGPVVLIVGVLSSLLMGLLVFSLRVSSSVLSSGPWM